MNAENKPAVHMYAGAVTEESLRLILESEEVPKHIAELPPATLRSSTFLASIILARQCTPPSTAFEVMNEAMPIIRKATGVYQPEL